MLAALAFAAAGQALPRILGVAAGAGVAAHWLSRTKLFEMLGRVRSREILTTASGGDPQHERGGLNKAPQPSIAQLIGRLAVAVALTAFTVWPAGKGVGGLQTHDQTAHHLRIAAYFCLCMAWVFHLFVYHRRRIAAARQWKGWTEQGVDVEPLDSPDWALRWKVIAGAIVSAAILGSFALWPVPFGRRIGALWVLSFVTANAVLFGSVSVWVGRRWGVDDEPAGFDRVVGTAGDEWL